MDNEKPRFITGEVVGQEDMIIPEDKRDNKQDEKEEENSK